MSAGLQAAGTFAMGYQHNWWQILTSAFMRNALIGGTLVALAAGLIGYFVIVRNTAFAAHALAHIGLPGATGAALLGLPVGLGLLAFCVGGALVIGALGSRAHDREVATGTVLALATGFGLFFNSLATKNSSTLTNVLFGNLLAITHQQLLNFTALLLLLAATVVFVFRPLLFASVNPQVAEAKGVPVRVLFALVVTPAATAIMVTARPILAMAISTGISVVSVWAGLAVSAIFNMPPSFVIVTIACGFWLAVWTVDRVRNSAIH
jgi:zinc/manganese transport system permease protein